MNEVLNPSHAGEFPYIVAGPFKIFRSASLPAARESSDPPPGLERRQWEDLKRAVLFNEKRKKNELLWFGLIFVWLALVMIFSDKLVSSKLLRLTATLLPTIVLLVFATRSNLRIAREAVEAQAPHIDQTTIYNLRFRTEKYACFTVGVMTLTRKSDPHEGHIA